MTEDYKINVLKQLTGQVNEEQGNNRPIFITTDATTNTLQEYIISQGYDSTHTFNYEASLTRNNQQLLFYDELNDGYNYSRFIVITDMDLNPLGIIKSWKSGTAFREWYQMLQNDTGEGRIYFIDYENTQYRLVYMNDPTSKKIADDYEVEMLYTYTLPISSTTAPMGLMKNPEGANFVIPCFNTSTNKIALNELVINVGSENEWNSYVYNTAVPGFSADCTLYPIWTEELDCRFCFVDTANGLELNVLNTQRSGDTLSLVLQSVIQLPEEAQEYSNMLGNLTMKNYNYLYCFSQGTISDDTTSYFYEVDLNNATMTILYTTPEYCTFDIQLINGEILFTRRYYDNVAGQEVLYFGMVSNHTYYETYVNSHGVIGAITFIINSYNLYSIRIIDGVYGNNFVDNLYVIYNPLNYNGAAFEGVQSVISNSVVLNNSDGVPIFARNLYNKTISQNTVESTVEIPAYQLNGITIAEQTLVSKNNNNIVFQYDDIEKNIYENVLMNFFNTLTIIDNNENKNKVMTAASNYFVNGLENQGYENLKALKYRITYTDNSTHIGTIGEMSINNNIATLGFVIYTGVGISKLEILSNDETMIYATIDETFDPSSYYKIVQEVVIN